MGESDRRPLRRLRLRFWFLFAAAALLSIILFGLIARLIVEPAPDAQARTRALVLLWSLVALVLLVSGGAWWLLYRAAFRDLFRFADELWIAAHGDAGTRVSLTTSPLLEPLAQAARLLAERLAALRHELDRAAAASAIRVEGEKVRLEAVLRDLTEAVVVCDLDSRVLLYNEAALRLLEPAGHLGLGRSLFNVVGGGPIAHTLAMLRERLAAGRREDLEADFVGSTAAGGRFLRVHLRLILEPDGECKSYVLALSDATQELDDLRQRDSLLTSLADGLRPPAAGVLAAADMLVAHPDMPAEQRRRLHEAVAAEGRALEARLDAAIGDHRRVLSRAWPLYDIHSADLIARVARGLDGEDIELTAVGAPLWLRGDSLSLAHALERLVRLVHRERGAARFDVALSSEGAQVMVDLVWTGPPIEPDVLESWLDERLPAMPGATSIGDVALRHGSQLSSEAIEEQARLRFPLPAPERPQAPARAPLPPRPVFYDFDLLDRLGDAGPRGGKPLRGLDFVVLDVETTGLAPTGGDEIVALAGVRVVNGRVLSGETFVRTVNPRMPIPPSSTAFHGITDEMVRDKPPIELVLHQFHGFCTDAVLVAHNAAFDMKFIALKQAAAGVVFDQPVLDTQLLTMAIGADWLDRSLEGIAERLGVTVRGRHSAPGDALATAEVLVRLMPLLEAAGVVTLDQALEVCRRQVRLPPGELCLRESGR